MRSTVILMLWVALWLLIDGLAFRFPLAAEQRASTKDPAMEKVMVALMAPETPAQTNEAGRWVKVMTSGK